MHPKGFTMTISLIALYAAFGLLSGCGSVPTAASAARQLDYQLNEVEVKAEPLAITESKAVYLAFLSCAQAAEADPAGKATIADGIANLRDLPDQFWDQHKTSLRISAVDFVWRYRKTCIKPKP